MNESPEVAAFARKMLKDLRAKYLHLDFYLTGGTMIDTAFGEASEDDMTTLIPIMFCVLLIIIGLVSWPTHFRRPYSSLQIGLYFVLEPIGAQNQAFVNSVTNVFDHAAVHMPREQRPVGLSSFRP